MKVDVFDSENDKDETKNFKIIISDKNDDNYGDILIKCPLVNKSIAEGYCYDINIVRTKQIKNDILKGRYQFKGSK